MVPLGMRFSTSQSTGSLPSLFARSREEIRGSSRGFSCFPPFPRHRGEERGKGSLGFEIFLRSSSPNAPLVDRRFPDMAHKVIDHRMQRG